MTFLDRENICPESKADGGPYDIFLYPNYIFKVHRFLPFTLILPLESVCSAVFFPFFSTPLPASAHFQSTLCFAEFEKTAHQVLQRSHWEAAQLCIFKFFFLIFPASRAAALTYLHRGGVQQCL